VQPKPNKPGFLKLRFTHNSYDSFVPELIRGRFRAKKLTMKYNTYMPDDATPDSLTADREVMIRQIFGKVGKEPWLEAPIYFDYGCNVSVGDRFYSNFKLVFSSCFRLC